MTTYYVSYCRVSTAKQGVSGLGLEAQQTTVRQYLEKQGIPSDHLIKEFIEVESGSHADRPQLMAALQHCKLTRAVLLVAKLDRLSRNANFITSLQESKVNFVVCDFPDANTFTIQIFAALAQYERELISERTKHALAVVRSRGKRLGNPQNLTVKAAAAGRAASTATRIRLAQEFAQDHISLVKHHRDAGLSLRQIASLMNAEKYASPSGQYGAWNASTVQRVLQRVTT